MAPYPIKDELDLTPLAERRIRGDLIEAFKAVNGFSSLDNIFNISRSGLNLVSKSVIVEGLTGKIGTFLLADLWLRYYDMTV